MPASEESPELYCSAPAGRYALAAERYALHEMPPEESAAFEIHFSPAGHALTGVILLMALFENGREVSPMESTGDNPSTYSSLVWVWRIRREIYACWLERRNAIQVE